MFGIFKKDPIKDLQKKYYKKLEDAMNAQRSGDIEGYSFLTAEAYSMNKKLQELKGVTEDSIPE